MQSLFLPVSLWLHPGPLSCAIMAVLLASCTTFDNNERIALNQDFGAPLVQTCNKSAEGIERGASKASFYAVRLSDSKPTRLHMDELDTAAWRAL